MQLALMFKKNKTGLIPVSRTGQSGCRGDVKLVSGIAKPKLIVLDIKKKIYTEGAGIKNIFGILMVALC